MKFAEKIIKLALAIGAVAGVIFLIAKYMDAIRAWADKLCPACEPEEEIIEEAVAEEAVEEVVEAPAEEVAAEEAPAEEAPVEEIVIEEGTPVAEETDFAE